MKMESIEERRPEHELCHEKNCPKLSEATIAYSVTTKGRFGQPKMEITEKEVCLEHSELIAVIAAAPDDRSKLKAIRSIQWKGSATTA